MKPHKIILTCFALLVLGVCSLVINTSANAAICHNGGRADYRGLIKYTKAAKRAKSHVECDTILKTVPAILSRLTTSKRATVRLNTRLTFRKSLKPNCTT